MTKLSLLLHAFGAVQVMILCYACGRILGPLGFIPAAAVCSLYVYFIHRPR